MKPGRLIGAAIAGMVFFAVLVLGLGMRADTPLPYIGAAICFGLSLLMGARLDRD